MMRRLMHELHEGHLGSYHKDEVSLHACMYGGLECGEIQFVSVTHVS